MFSLYSFLFIFIIFFFNATATTEIYTLSLHDALPICVVRQRPSRAFRPLGIGYWSLLGHWCLVIGHSRLLPNPVRSEEHTSELQSQSNLVCRLLLEKKK